MSLLINSSPQHHYRCEVEVVMLATHEGPDSQQQRRTSRVKEQRLLHVVHDNMVELSSPK